MPLVTTGGPNIWPAYHVTSLVVVHPMPIGLYQLDLLIFFLLIIGNT